MWREREKYLAVILGLPVDSVEGGSTRKATHFCFQVIRQESKSRVGVEEFLVARDASAGKAKTPVVGILGELWAF